MCRVAKWKYIGHQEKAHIQRREKKKCRGKIGPDMTTIKQNKREVISWQKLEQEHKEPIETALYVTAL